MSKRGERELSERRNLLALEALRDAREESKREFAREVAERWPVALSVAPGIRSELLYYEKHGRWPEEE